jgi:squalene-associated FAD-dependent desaturase
VNTSETAGTAFSGSSSATVVEPRPDVVIVGGGLAGLAAAAAAVEAGLTVELVEGRRQCGGRAASFEDASDGTLVDACQHVAMGCCTNFLDLCRLAGIGAQLRRDRTLWFIGPDGQRAACTPAGWLPAPLHLAPLLLGMRHFSLREKFALAVGMLRLASWKPAPGEALEPTASAWLTARQPARVIELFWQPVIESALGESIDLVGLSAVKKVAVDGFLAHPTASDLWVPTRPLGELFGDRLVGWLTSRGVRVLTGSQVTAVERDARGRATGVRVAGKLLEAGAVILAVPWRAAVRLVPDLLPPVADTFAGSPITAVHLWFDRPIIDLPHAVLVGRVSQWVFQGDEAPSGGPSAVGDEQAHHCQVVISASRGLCDGDRQLLLETVVGELREIFPAARQARLLRSRIVTDPTAVLSVRPGVDRVRPGAETVVPNLFLAGDWTATGWPSTMEGAVRSGRLAAAEAAREVGRSARPLTADLPKNYLIRMVAAR